MINLHPAVEDFARSSLFSPYYNKPWLRIDPLNPELLGYTFDV